MRRIALTGGLLIFSDGGALQIAMGASLTKGCLGLSMLVGLLIAMLSHRIYSGVEPFINDDDDIIAEVAQTQLVLVFFANLLLYVGEHTEDEASFATNLFGVVLVLVMSAGAFAAIYYILVDTFGEDKVERYFEEAKASSRSLLSSVSESARGLNFKAAE